MKNQCISKFGISQFFPVIGTSCFMENKTMHFEKSQFMATVKIPIHEEKNTHFTYFTSNKKG